MKKKLLFLIVLLITTFDYAQRNRYEFGLAPSYEIPIGNLSSRFKPAIGLNFNIKVYENESWKWFGVFQYTHFNKPNYDKLIKKVEVQNGLDKELYDFPLKLNLSLETTLLLLEANYFIYKNQFFNSNIIFSFGFTNWTYKREQYKDSLLIKINNSNLTTNISTLDVPSNSQTDWSGTILFGINSSINVVNNIDIYLQTNYKLIIGELWPALSLDMENVSGLQTISLILGLKAKF